MADPIVGAQGGSMEPLLRKLVIKRNFVTNATLYINTLSKRTTKKVHRFKMVAKLPIFASHHFDFG